MLATLIEYFCFHFASVQTLLFLKKNDFVLVRMTLKEIQNGMHPFSVALDFTLYNYILGGGGVITVGNVLSERRGDPICAFTWRVCCSQLDSFKELM